MLSKYFTIFSFHSVKPAELLLHLIIMGYIYKSAYLYFSNILNVAFVLNSSELFNAKSQPCM